jgi:hypothetical protein
VSCDAQVGRSKAGDEKFPSQVSVLTREDFATVVIRVDAFARLFVANSAAASLYHSSASSLLHTSDSQHGTLSFKDILTSAYSVLDLFMLFLFGYPLSYLIEKDVAEQNHFSY